MSQKPHPVSETVPYYPDEEESDEEESVEKFHYSDQKVPVSSSSDEGLESADDHSDDELQTKPTQPYTNSLRYSAELFGKNFSAQKTTTSNFDLYNGDKKPTAKLALPKQAKLKHKNSNGGTVLKKVAEAKPKENIFYYPNNVSTPKHLHSNIPSFSFLSKYFKNSSLSDITIKVKDRTFPAHKFVLCGRSKLWERLISSKKDLEVLEIDDAMPEVFETFLYYIYTFDCKLPAFPSGYFEPILQLATLATNHEAQEYMDFISQKIGMCLTCLNVCESIERVRKVGNQQLEKSCWNFLSKCYTDAVQSDGFYQMSMSTLEAMLKEDLLMLDESKIFWLLTMYSSNKKGSLGEVLKDLIPHIRFPLMSVQDLAKIVEPSNVLDKEDLLQVMLYAGSKGKVGNPKFSTKPRENGGSMEQFNGDLIVWDCMSSIICAKYPRKVTVGGFSSYGTSSSKYESMCLSYSSYEITATHPDILITLIPYGKQIIGIGFAHPSLAKTKMFTPGTQWNGYMFFDGGVLCTLGGLNDSKRYPDFKSGDLLSLWISPKEKRFRMTSGKWNKQWPWDVKVEFPLCLAVYLTSPGDSCEIVSAETVENSLI